MLNQSKISASVTSRPFCDLPSQPIQGSRPVRPPYGLVQGTYHIITFLPRTIVAFPQTPLDSAHKLFVACPGIYANVFRVRRGLLYAHAHRELKTVQCLPSVPVRHFGQKREEGGWDSRKRRWV